MRKYFAGLKVCIYAVASNLVADLIMKALGR
jgi:hypothetical protein